MAWKIPLFKIYWDEEDVRMVSDAIKVGMNWATGPNVGKFEELIASYVCTKYALTFNSGTSEIADDHNLILIEDAAESLGARIGDENMKICYISTKSIHTRRWVEYFAEKGHEVHLITHLKSCGVLICQ